MEEKAVHVTLPNGMVRTAKYFGDQGCICLPEGRETLGFTPQEISTTLPDPATQPWPMGDLIEESPAPEGFVDFVSTLAPAWKADGRPIYGGFFWINGDEGMRIPKDAYFMAGAGGQLTIIIPSHDLVVVKLTHYKGAAQGRPLLNAALSMLLEAVN